MTRLMPCATVLLVFALLSGVCTSAPGEDVKITATTLENAASGNSVIGLDPSLQKEAATAVDRALDWLAEHQRDNGSWSNTNFPALTALPLWAFANSDHSSKARVVKRASAFLTSCVQQDGGIYRKIPGRKGGGLGNYNTSLSITALHATRDPKFIPTIRKGRKFIANSQHFGDDIYRGGMGYDKSTKRAYADLMNSVIAFEAMRLTADVEETRKDGEKRVDIDWKEARNFLKRLQNDKNTTGEDAGGFPYRPDESKAGTTTNAAGQVVFRSYGSMTYAGLLAMIYADVDRKDPRVRSAFDWATKHWSLDENPGMGQQGLYFFLNIITKALAAYGQDRVRVLDEKDILWRKSLVERIVALQKTDTEGRGYWVNETARFWESDRVLTTAYSIIALQIAARL